MHRWLTAGALLFVAQVLAAPDTPADLAQDLQRIKKAGREGAGNAEAAKAWKAIVARGSDALLPVLAAMNDDDLPSANWLRPAFEAIAEKLLAGGKDLPKAELEKFLARRKNPGIARRVAYEWLVKIDPATPARYLPKMLDDPSPELRRDAVARVMDEAKSLAASKDAGARAAYEKAFAAACDPEQVDAIAEALGKLGVKVDRAKHLGFVRTWQLIAPFDHHKGVGWNRAYPPEKGADLSATYKGKDGKTARWSEHTTTDAHGMVDLNKVLGKMKGTVAYAHAVVDSPKERLVELRVASMNGLKVFLNGKEVFAREEYHHGMPVDQYTARGTLKQGRNEILLKVCQNEQEENWAQDWKFQLRLCEPVGAAVPFTEKGTEAPARNPRKPEAPARNPRKPEAPARNPKQEGK
jgi:hypothetical protein